MHTLVLERAPAENRNDLELECRLAERLAELIRRDLFAVEVFCGERFIEPRNRFDQILTGLGDRTLQLCGNLALMKFGPQRIVIPVDRLFGQQIHHALEAVFGSDWNLEGKSVRTESIANHANDAGEVRTNPIHLVHEVDARHTVAIRLSPNRFGLRLNPRDCTEDANRSIQNPKGSLHLDREIDMARRVDDVDPMVLPEAGRRGSRDGDPALLFLLHPIHRRRAVVDLTDLVIDTRVVEDPLGRSRLAGIDVGHDADVPSPFERCHAGHFRESKFSVDRFYQR